MTDARQIAVVTEPFSDGPGFVAALRAMREKRNISCERLDEICGLPKGYVQKLLADPPVKNVGPISMFPLIGGVGTAMVLVDDPDALRRLASRMIERDKSQVRSGAKHPLIVIKLSARRMKKLGALGGAARARKLTKRKRQQIARHAAKQRWHKPKMVEIVNEAEKNAILEQARAPGGSDSRPRPDAHQSAGPQGLNARAGKRRPQA